LADELVDRINVLIGGINQCNESIRLCTDVRNGPHYLKINVFDGMRLVSYGLLEKIHQLCSVVGLRKSVGLGLFIERSHKHHDKRSKFFRGDQYSYTAYDSFDPLHQDIDGTCMLLFGVGLLCVSPAAPARNDALRDVDSCIREVVRKLSDKLYRLLADLLLFSVSLEDDKGTLFAFLNRYIAMAQRVVRVVNFLVDGHYGMLDAEEHISAFLDFKDLDSDRKHPELHFCRTFVRTRYDALNKSLSEILANMIACICEGNAIAPDIDCGEVPVVRTDGVFSEEQRAYMRKRVDGARVFSDSLFRSLLNALDTIHPRLGYVPIARPIFSRDGSLTMIPLSGGIMTWKMYLENMLLPYADGYVRRGMPPTINTIVTSVRYWAAIFKSLEYSFRDGRFEPEPFFNELLRVSDGNLTSIRAYAERILQAKPLDRLSRIVAFDAMNKYAASKTKSQDLFLQYEGYVPCRWDIAAFVNRDIYCLSVKDGALASKYFKAYDCEHENELVDFVASIDCIKHVETTNPAHEILTRTRKSIKKIPKPLKPAEPSGLDVLAAVALSGAVQAEKPSQKKRRVAAVGADDAAAVPPSSGLDFLYAATRGV